jgi:hypothetical protein
VGLRTSFEDMDRRKFLSLPGIELRSLGLQFGANKCTDWFTNIFNLEISIDSSILLVGI